MNTVMSLARAVAALAEPDGELWATSQEWLAKSMEEAGETGPALEIGAGLVDWHARHKFCANCGSPTKLTKGGWQRNCDNCGAEHFPRTDPVTIMLVEHEDKLLLGRQPRFPPKIYSALAGFVEPGETIEEAVAREVYEEAGVRVSNVRYLASQPWPFPSSLMFGCAGEALDTEIKIDPAEIEDARWFSRTEMMQAFAGEHPMLKPARKGAIAHFLLQNWLADTLD